MPARPPGALGGRGEPHHAPGRKVSPGPSDDGLPGHDRDLPGADPGRGTDLGKPGTGKMPVPDRGRN